MPVSIVVGGQFGSEGKGKVALDMVRRDPTIRFVVRPGGTNSGHTGFARDGRQWVLRQLPAAAIDGNVTIVFPAGAYIDVHLLGREIAELGLPLSRVKIDPRAHIIRPEHIEWEEMSGLVGGIGSTGSGTGAAVLSRLARYAGSFPLGVQARDDERLQPLLAEADDVLFPALDRGDRILIEGTQGFGLSPLHADAWPKATSRDTTASAFMGESGLPPSVADEVVIVVRAFPIRVSGDSGPLCGETDWSTIQREAGAQRDLTERTSVTNRVRRVGKFDAEAVRKAIRINGATKIVLNHVDHVDARVFESDQLTSKAIGFISSIEQSLGEPISWIGTGPRSRIAWNRDQDARNGVNAC